MPELPEVETVVLQLRPVLLGQRFLGIEIADPRLGRGLSATPTTGEISRVLRAGKQVVLEIVPNMAPAVFLGIHLRMTGRLVWIASIPGAGGDVPVRAAPLELLPDLERGSDLRIEHLRARFRLSGGELLFYDARRFGTIRLSDSPESHSLGGLDPLADECTAEAIFALTRKRKTPIKTWLLNQDAIEGIGNIYASEILYDARIAPTRVTGHLSRAECASLHASMRRILRAAIRFGGTTFSDFRDSRGESGSYGSLLQVYDRAGQPCRRCGELVIRSVQAGRSTFACPRCQRRGVHQSSFEESPDEPLSPLPKL